MGQIDRTGTFRFQIVDSGIYENKDDKSNVIQWAAELLATEYYDEDTEQWIDWSEYDEREIMCFLTLFGKEGQPVFQCQQLQKAVGWSGADFNELDTEYLEGVVFQGYVGEDTYNGKTSLKVLRVDVYDAEPGKKLRKLDRDAVKKLNAKHATKLRELSGGNKPKSVGAPKVDKEAAKEAAKQKLADRKAKGKKAEENAAKIEPPKPPKPPTPPQAPKPKQKAEVIDKGRAWIECCQGRDESISDKDLENAWHAEIDKLGGEDAVDANNQWAEVRDKVFAALKIPF